MVTWLNGWHRAFGQWLGLVTKVSCPLCQRPTAAVFCPNCQRQLQQCRLATKGWVHTQELPVLAWGSYSGALKRAIAAMKYHNRPETAVPLGCWLAEAWREVERNQAAIVVPIPMHKDKQKQRGFNQAELLANAFTAMTGLPHQPQGLQRIRATEAQFRLSNPARVDNLQDAFAVGTRWLKQPPTQPVLLLDDIYTTGATARSAAHTLRSHGIRVQGVVVLAIAQRDA